LPEGSNRAIPCNVRIIASCSPDVYESISLRHFDVELFDRLAESLVETIGLADRVSDVRPLAQHFLNHWSRVRRLSEIRLESSALEWLSNRDWPGNVGELRNFVHDLANEVPAHSIDHETIRMWLVQRHSRQVLPS
jgi:DNA-binding NtrC family response regulator